MAAEVRDLTPDKLFKIAKLNLRGRAKEWFQRLQPAPADWAGLCALMIQKYGNIDADDIRMKLDAIKQEPRERVQKYFKRQDKLFRRGQIQDVEQRRRFLARLRPEIRKLCIVRTFSDIEDLVEAAMEVEGVLAELGETPYEPLQEEQEENASESKVEKQVAALNRLGHSEDKCWKKPRDGKSASGMANFLEIMLNDEVATKQQLNRLCGNENAFSYTRLARRKRDSETTENQASVVSASPSIRKICVSKTHRSKTLHLPIEISDCIIEGLVDTGASMSVLATAVVRELGMMHLVTGNESYKTASGVITRALGRVEEVQRVNVGQGRNGATISVKDGSADQDPEVGSYRDQRTDEGEEDASISDDESDNDEFHDSESNPLEQSNSDDEFVDPELEELVNSEGPEGMLQLMLQERTDKIMAEEDSNGDDYAD
ncbi:unnamed protein product [Sphagnum balticum]